MKNLAIIIGLTFVFGTTSFSRQQSATSALASLVAAERSFAQTSVRVGIRKSFMTYFADEAIVFRPHPIRYKDAVRDVPPPKNPLGATLSWEPIYADISLAGDLGYTTGPYTLADNTGSGRPAQNGFYFSIWKKQAGGEWKVVFDGGCETPGPYLGSRELQPAPERGKIVTDPTKARDFHLSRVQNGEQIFLETMRKSGTMRSLDAFIDPHVRIYRQGENPIVGSDAIRAYFSVRPYLTSWKPMFVDAASSGDLGYAYGSYELRTGEDTEKETEKGYYIRVWKLVEKNQWKIVHEVTSPLPPQPTKE